MPNAKACFEPNSKQRVLANVDIIRATECINQTSRGKHIICLLAVCSVNVACVICIFTFFAFIFECRHTLHEMNMILLNQLDRNEVRNTTLLDIALSRLKINALMNIHLCKFCHY